MACPNKNLTEWKNLANTVGEFEAMRVFMMNNNDVPPIFAEKLEKRTIELLAKEFTNRIGVNDQQELKSLLTVESLKLSQKENDYSKVDSLNNALIEGFLKDFNVTVSEYESIKEVFGVDAVGMSDFLQKFIALEKGESITPHAAYFAYKLLGRANNKLRGEINFRISAWEGYQASYQKHAQEILKERGWTEDTKEFKAFVKEKIAVDFLEKTLVEYYNNPEEFAIEHAERQFTGEDWKKSQRWLNKLKRWIESLLYKINAVKNRGLTIRLGKNTLIEVKGRKQSQEVLDNISKQIVSEMLSQEYDIFDYTKSDKEIQKHYEETIETDPEAEEIVKHAWKLGWILTGSLALRRVGSVFRTVKESLHDLDFVVPHSILKSPKILQELLDSADIYVNMMKGITDFKSKKAALARTTLMDATEETLKKLSWYQEFIKEYPSFTPIVSFISKDNFETKDSITFTGVIDGRFYTEDGYHTVVENKQNIRKKHKKGDYIRGTGYIIDLFLRPNSSLKDTQTDGFKSWMEIFVAKLTFSRDKDLKYHRYFIPFAKQGPKDMFVYKDWVYKKHEVPEVSPILEAYLETKIPAEQRESRKAFKKKKSILQKSLHADVIEDPNLSVAGVVLPYEPGETPRVAINPNYHTGETLIHEFGHVLIDFMGGMSSPLIRQGRKYLEGTDLEAEVLELHSEETNQEKLNKEVLATAIGKEGEAIYNAENGNLISRFKSWLKIFTNRLKKLLGLDYNVAMELANMLLNNDLSSVYMDNTGNPYAQEQRLPKKTTETQQEANTRLDRIDERFSLTDDVKHYIDSVDNTLYKRNSDRIDEVFGADKYDAKLRAKFENNRQWGNKIDDIFTGVINGQSLSQVRESIKKKESMPIHAAYKTANISEEALRDIYAAAQEFVSEIVAGGSIVRTQSTVYSRDTGVAGTTDILIIEPDGSLRIVDIKSSWYPTSRPYKVKSGNFKISYNNRGKHTSTREKHTRQQSAYQKMYEDLGFNVKSIKIFPINLANVQRNIVQGVTIEPIITLRYNTLTANRVIDNKNKRKREQLEFNPEIEEKLKELATEIRNRVHLVFNDYKETKNKKFADELEVLVMQMQEGEDLTNLITYIQEANKRSFNILTRLDNIKQGEENLTGEVLKNIKTFAGAFNLINDAYSLLLEADKLIREIPKAKRTKQQNLVLRYLSGSEGRTGTKKDIESVLTNLNEIKETTHILSKDYIANMLAPQSKRTEYFYRKHFEKKYRRENPFSKEKESRTEYKEKIQEYVNEQIAENQQQIEEAHLQSIKDLLSFSPKDTGIMVSLFADPKNINDPVLQLTIKLLERADYKARQEFILEVHKIERIYDKFKEAKGNPTNQTVLYEDLLERDPSTGELTGFMVGKYFSKMKEITNTWYSENPTPKAKEIKDFHAEAKKTYANPQWKKLLEMRNGTAEEKAIYEMYEHLVEKAEEKDEMVPAGSRLGVRFSDFFDTNTRIHEYVYTYRIPTIEKTAFERVTEQGVKTAIFQGAKDLVVEDVEFLEKGQKEADTEEDSPHDLETVNDDYVKIITDASGKEKQFVPVFFRGKHRDQESIFAPSPLQTYDLVSASLMDLYTTLNYHEKKLIEADIILIKDLVQERDVGRVSGLKQVVTYFQGKMGGAYKLSGENSEAFKALKSLVDTRMYGITTEGIIAGWEGNIGPISGVKVGNLLMAWTGHAMLMLNRISALTSTLQGKTMNALEAFAGIHMTGKSLRQAEVTYWKNLPGFLNDALGKKVNHNLVNLLAEKYDALSEYHGLSGSQRFSNLNRVLQKANAGTGHFLQNTQEHYTQLTSMLGILHEGTITNSKGEVSTLFDAHYEKDGELFIKDDFKEAVDEQDYQLSIKIKEVSKQSHGNYDSKNLSRIQRFVLGKMMFMLRKWLVPGTQRRWRGGSKLRSNIFKESDILTDMESSFYSEMTEEEQNGLYITALRVFGAIGFELDSWKMELNREDINSKWNTLTHTEKADVRRTTVEFAAIILSLMGSWILQHLAEEEEDEKKKEKLYYTLLLTYRLYLELHFYSNPIEGWKLLKSPAATLSMIERTSDLFEQWGKDILPDESKDKGWFTAERYVKKSHPLYGERKWRKKFRKIVPIFSQVDRDAENIYKWISGNQ